MATRYVYQFNVHAIVEVNSSAAWRRERGGVRLLRSIDGDLWLASLAASAVREDRLPPVVEAAWDLRADDRIDPRLLADLSTGEGLLDVRVKVFRDESIESVRDAIRRVGGEVCAEAPKLGVLDVSIRHTVVRDLAERMGAVVRGANAEGGGFRVCLAFDAADA